jgi:uncharacterized radical SAM superfamily protein
MKHMVSALEQIIVVGNYLLTNCLHCAKKRFQTSRPPP